MRRNLVAEFMECGAKTGRDSLPSVTKRRAVAPSAPHPLRVVGVIAVNRTHYQLSNFPKKDVEFQVDSLGFQSELCTSRPASLYCHCRDFWTRAIPSVRSLTSFHPQLSRGESPWRLPHYPNRETLEASRSTP